MASNEERLTRLESDMMNVKTRLAVAESAIKDVKDDVKEIKNDTKWLRRAITNAMIVSIIGGIIGLFFALLKGGANL